MKNKRAFILFLFFLSFSAFFVCGKAQALDLTKRSQVLQKIEILKHEVSLLQMLLLNMKARQEIGASSYLAINLSDNSIRLDKNSGRAYPIASVTKLMSAVIAMENINVSQKITLTEEMLRPLGQSPSLFKGLTVSAENLVKASLIQSTNDASESLACFLGKKEFIALMNQKAEKLGMSKTFFKDAHGLDSGNQSTAQDIVKLLSYIHDNHPEILNITRSNNFWLPDSSGRLLKFQNVNNFYPLPSFVGGKTGYLPEAKQTLAGIFNVNGNPVAIAILYSNNRQADLFAILRAINNK